MTADSSIARPPYTSSQTATTILSTTSYASSGFDHRSGTSTALTTPDLGSPGKHKATFEPLLEISEGVEEEQVTEIAAPRSSGMDPRYEDEGPGRRVGLSMELSRGPSVKDRASQFEQQVQSSAPSSSRDRPLPQPMGRTRSTSPLRINRKASNTTSSTALQTPTNARRIPIPATAPVQRINPGDVFDSHAFQEQSLRRTPPELKRGKGSAKRMIQQWESLPSTPAEDRPRLPGLGTPRSARIMSREYLEKKPLPIPQATQIPASSSSYSYSPGPSRPSPRSAYVPSPLQHLQTPTHAHSSRKRSATLTPSPSSYSISSSPSNDKRKRAGGRSPLKEMMNKFGGGIQAISRKAKGKGKEKAFIRSESFGFGDEDGTMERVGSNGLPGGIVFRDRMGEAEMNDRGPADPNAVRTSAIMYLIPTPCSSVAPWGSWLSSWATLTSTTLHVTYCPIFQDPKSGHSTPRRVLSGANPTQASCPAVAFGQIPQPDPSITPDVELAMRDCVEVRSLRRDEVKGRGIPPVPEGVGTEVLEMVWSDGSKRYIGVEGVAGRLGWVSSIWDVLLACKTDQPPSLPPPSPVVSRTEPSQVPTASLASFPYPATSQPRGELSDFRARLASLEARSGGSSAPAVQKFGDTWVAASALEAGSSEVDADRPRPQLDGERKAGGDRALRNSVQRMFETGPDADPALGALSAMELFKEEAMPTRRNSEISERILAWQPKTERELSIFSRSDSTKRSEVSAVPSSEIERDLGNFPKSETTLSFDPNDLNPSRSASQVRRTPSTLLGLDAKARRCGYLGNSKAMPALEEQSADGISKVSDDLGKPPTHISHVTFPKPTLAGQQMLHATSLPLASAGMTTLPTIPSAPTSSCGTGRSDELQTPRTTHSSVTTVSVADPTVIAKLDSHSNEHGTLARQIDHVQIDLQHILTSLGGLVQQTKTISQTQDHGQETVPKVLDDKLETLRLDVKGIENALQLSTLASNRQQPQLPEEPKLVEVHSKLDSIVRLCEEVLAKQAHANPGPVENAEIDGLPVRASRVGAANSEAIKSATPVSGVKGNSLGVRTESEEEKSAGQEVALIMADLTGGSSKTSPKLGGIQVLHNASAPPSPKPASPPAAAALPNAVTQQVGEVLDLVKELKEARSLQTQQTTDIARYLNELNSWLEKFVVNSSSELGSMSKKLETLVGPDQPPADGGPVPVALPDMIADVHSMMSEQKRRNDEEGMVGQRLDALLRMMGEDKERQAGQQSTVEQVVSIIDRQRHDNEMLLRALATDLTTEIRGERIRFVEAMQQATSVNVAMHVEEFKKVLAAEVDRSMKELGQMREEKKVLEHQISDLFAIMAKHSSGGGGGKMRKGATAPLAAAPPMAYSPMNRGLPAPPPR